MAKQMNIFQAALFLSLLAVTVTATITELHNLSNSKCKKVDVQEVNHCMMYLTPAPDRKGQNGQTLHLPECCGQLDEVETKCRCMAIKEVLWRLQNQQSRAGRTQWTTEDVDQMKEDAQGLFRICNVELKEPCIIVSDLPNYSDD